MAKKKIFPDEYQTDEWTKMLNLGEEEDEESTYPNKGIGPTRTKMPSPDESASAYPNKGIGPARHKIPVRDDESESGTANAMETRASTTLKQIPDIDKEGPRALRGMSQSTDIAEGTPPERNPAVESQKPLSSVKTKGGDYPVYKKGSSDSNEFAAAFAAALAETRKAGKKVGTFEWRGRKYSTALK